MSSSDNKGSLDGQESASDLTVSNIIGIEIGAAGTSQNMSKRVAARGLISQYYSQLTEGCGNDACSNENCASSHQFRFKDSDKNTLAVQALSLCKIKAKLCERRPIKISRLPTDGDADGPSYYKPVGMGAKSKIPSPTSSYSATNIGLDLNSSGGGSTLLETQFLTEEILIAVIDECRATGSWSKLVHLIGSVFNNPESLIKSFRKCPQVATQSNNEATAANEATACASLDKYSVQESQNSGNVSDGKRDTILLTVDLPSLRRAYQRLMDVPEQYIQGPLINALKSLSQTVEMELRYRNILESNPDYINVFVIVMEIPMLMSPEYLEAAFPCICRAIGMLHISGQARLAKIWALFGHDRIKDMVQSLQQMITIKVINNEGKWSATLRPSEDPAITNATKVLKILYYANIVGGKLDSSDLVAEEKRLNEAESLQDLMQGAFGHEPKDTTPPKEDPLGKELGVEVVNCREPLIPYEEFINEPLNDNLDIGVDYTNYRLESENKFSFVPYCFILTTASKHTSMYYDNRIRMLQERRTAFVQTLVHGGPSNPFLRVRVRRDHIIDDALVNLEMIAMDNPSDLRKQLFVEFEGEQGLDEGGVSKEFFQLIVEELFNPDIGMFTYNEESHHFWFNSSSFENDAQFTLIGILLGLAIYNSCILDIHFPMVVYRKLMGKKGTYRDLYDVDPTLMRSLQDMIDYQKDDFVDVFDLIFRIGFDDVFGQSHTHDLKENAECVVTQANKQEFVDLYADYLLNKSIEQQFRAFKRGFLMVTSESPLKQLFRPEEIEVLVCGSKILDFHALEEATEYDGGFTEDSQTVRNFWSVVHAMPEDSKKKLLQFTTGTDRVPIGGLSKLKMIIARNGPDSDRLPTSHTCFNVLLLPEYVTVEKLKDRLLKAINYSKGFGML
uniref:HECT-type E3 ubiquitin transferase n=1 Tax=Arion vulgaris TaxID=1028688 RepID=A0A0B6ZJY5_9EUPU